MHDEISGVVLVNNVLLTGSVPVDNSLFKWVGIVSFCLYHACKFNLTHTSEMDITPIPDYFTLVMTLMILDLLHWIDFMFSIG